MYITGNADCLFARLALVNEFFIYCDNTNACVIIAVAMVRRAFPVTGFC
jgi:hypothetical protein